MSCRLLVSALMLSFKQNFLDWLLGRQPNVRALGGQAAPLRSKASLSRLAGASHGQLSPLAGPRASISVLCSSSQPSSSVAPGSEQVGSSSPAGWGPAAKFQSKKSCVPAASQHSIPPLLLSCSDAQAWAGQAASPSHRAAPGSCMGSLGGPFCWTGQPGPALD